MINRRRRQNVEGKRNQQVICTRCQEWEHKRSQDKARINGTHFKVEETPKDWLQ